MNIIKKYFFASFLSLCVVTTIWSEGYIFPSHFVMEFLARCMSVKDIKDIKKNNFNLSVKGYLVQGKVLYSGDAATKHYDFNKTSKDPVEGAYASFSLSQQGDQVIIKSTIEDRSLSSLTDLDMYEQDDLFALKGNPFEDKDLYSNCIYTRKKDLCDSNKKMAWITFHGQCQTTISLQEFQEFRKFLLRKFLQRKTKD